MGTYHEIMAITAETPTGPAFYFPFTEPDALFPLDVVAGRLTTESNVGASAVNMQGVPGPFRTRSTAWRSQGGWFRLTTKTSTPGAQTRMLWVRTSDGAALTSGYDGNPNLTLMGDRTGDVWDGFGIHGGEVLYSRYNNTTWQHTYSDKSVSDNKWHHLAVTYDGSTSRTVSIYVDGVLDGTGTISAHQNQGGVTSLLAGYGDAQGVTGYAELAHAAHWDVCLSAARVKSIFMAGRREMSQNKRGALL